MNLVAHHVDRGHDQGVGAERDEVAMGEVGEPQDAEQQADAEAGQRVEAAQAERVDQILQEADHSATPPSAADPAVAAGCSPKPKYASKIAFRPAGCSPDREVGCGRRAGHRCDPRIQYALR